MIPDLIGTLQQMLPVWVSVPLLALIAAFAIPGWWNWLRSKQIKGQVRRMMRAPSSEARDEHAENAFALAAGSARRLSYLADELFRLNQRVLFDRALAELKATGKALEDVRRLSAKVAVEKKRGRHPIEEAVIIERMWEEGMHEAARERLAEVMRRHPGDADLQELEQTLAELAAAASEAS